MKIAFIGARGVNNYGGFETAVTEYSKILTKNGCTVSCSCESYNPNVTIENLNQSVFPYKMPKNYFLRKIFEVFYDLYFNIYYLNKVDLYYNLGVSAGVFTIIGKLFKITTCVNIDGIEWNRDKFSAFEKTLIKICFCISITSADNIIIDNKSLLNFIPSKYHKKAIYITYGSEHFIKATYGVTETNQDPFPDNYWLVIARLEPENNILEIIKGYIESQSKRPLVIIGDTTSISYRDKLLKVIGNNANIKMVNSIYDKYIILKYRKNCFAYLHGHSVGGTNPSLLEAMASGSIILAHENEFNKEVGGNDCLYFTTSSNLACQMRWVEENYSTAKHLRNRIITNVKKNYSWDVEAKKIIDLR